MTTSDKPTVDLVLDDLEKEVKAPDPYTVAIKGGSRITFKDPFDFRLNERQELVRIMDGIQNGTTDDLDFLSKIMSKDDLDKYEKSNPHIRVHNLMMQKIMDHFRGALGK